MSASCTDLVFIQLALGKVLEPDLVLFHFGLISQQSEVSASTPSNCIGPAFHHWLAQLSFSWIKFQQGLVSACPPWTQLDFCYWLALFFSILWWHINSKRWVQVQITLSMFQCSDMHFSWILRLLINRCRWVRAPRFALTVCLIQWRTLLFHFVAEKWQQNYVSASSSPCTLHFSH